MTDESYNFAMGYTAACVMEQAIHTSHTTKLSLDQALGHMAAVCDVCWGLSNWDPSSPFCKLSVAIRMATAGLEDERRRRHEATGFAGPAYAPRTSSIVGDLVCELERAGLLLRSGR